MPIWFWVLLSSPLWIAPAIIILMVIGLIAAAVFGGLAYLVAYIHDVIINAWNKVMGGGK